MKWFLHLVWCLHSYSISTRLRSWILFFSFPRLSFSVASFLIVVDLVEWRLSSCEAVIKVFVIFIIIIIYMKGGRYQRWGPCARWTQYDQSQRSEAHTHSHTDAFLLQTITSVCIIYAHLSFYWIFYYGHDMKQCVMRPVCPGSLLI